MTHLQYQLHAIAEELAGSKVFLDVSWRVSAQAGPPIETSSATAEAALAQFIAILLDREPERLARLTDTPSAAQPATPPASPPANRRASTAQIGAANRQRVRALHAAGKTPRQIMAELAMPSSTVHTHLAAIRQEQAAADDSRPVVRIGNGEHWCAACGIEPLTDSYRFYARPTSREG
jgi:hypothetical protein